MESLTLIQDNTVWDAFVAQEQGHLLQTSTWGDLKSRFGWQAERWGRFQDGALVAGAQVLYRRLLPGVELAYVPRGPVAADADLMTELRTRVRRRGVFMVKIEPDWLCEDPRNVVLAQAGWRPSAETIQPSATIRLDLTRDLDALLGAMKPKWRYNIRLADKKGVLVREGAPADLPRFYELTRITAERDRFGIHGAEYYRCAFELLTSRDMVRLLVAEYEGQSLAMIFVTFAGHEAIYLYGASGNEHRNVMPNHALHWKAIQLAKARGCTQYDLWGVPVNVGAGEEQLPGSLYQFKQGFGGAVVQYSGAFDFVTNPVVHTLYQAARRIRRRGLG
ncbi:MAG: peptidoglycan bridge formation glycyltransferase FemA/FemB family protein [Anaerolineae bacterium]